MASISPFADAVSRRGAPDFIGRNLTVEKLSGGGIEAMIVGANTYIPVHGVVVVSR
jgi:uncharacterized protein (UPF0248 family)